MIQSLERRKNLFEAFPLNAQVPENSSPKHNGILNHINWPGCNIQHPGFPPCHTAICLRVIEIQKLLDFHQALELTDHIKNSVDPKRSKRSQLGKMMRLEDLMVLLIMVSFSFFKGHFFFKQNTGPSKQGPSFFPSAQHRVARWDCWTLINNTANSRVISGTPVLGPPDHKFPILFPYHSHIFRDSYGSGMGIV